MRTFLYGVMEGFARLHAWILTWNDGIEGRFSDKELHFLVFGVGSLLLFVVVHRLFQWLAEHSIATISWLYTFTVVVVLAFAIEIGQHQSGTGYMEFMDIVYGVYGFLVFVAAYLLLVFVGKRIWKAMGQSRRKNGRTEEHSE